jgi:hypothetical protein
MLKQIYTIVFTLLLSLTFSGILVAQSLAGSDKDLYLGPVPKEKTQDGQNISTSFNSDLALLYDNGPLITHPGGGSGGADASALQTALTLTIYGFGAQISANNSVADDFTIVGSDWAIDEIQFFTYQTGSTTTSTINDVRMQIWNGAPNGGGSVIYGDLTTNRLSSTSWTNMYRVLDTDLLNTQRPVMRVVVQFSPALVLSAGTYWLQWQYGGTLASGPWAPPVSVVGQTTTGNGLQNLAGVWGPLLDGTFPQGVPFLIFGNSGPPCPVGAATNPNPSDGAIDVPISGNTATWTNGAGTSQVELWFGEVGSLAQVYSGPSISSFALPTLQYLTDYGWYVICKNDTCGVQGPTWTFTTVQDPNIVNLFCDDFEAGTGNWTITNDGGSSGCVWQIRFAPFPNIYTLPPTSTGGILAADVDECGSGSTMLSTATITNALDATMYQNVWIEFDNDWRILDAQDEAHVEVSTDGGSTWTGVWDQIGVDVRNTHENIVISNEVALTSFMVRFRSVQPGWDWWWVVDNVCIYGSDPIPVELTSFTVIANFEEVELSWITSTETNNLGFEVQRSTGGDFEKIAFIEGHGTTTESQAYTYIDRSINSGSYSYRLKQVDFDGSFEYSNVIEVEVPVLKEFALDQNYPNPFNPSTNIEFRLAVDSKVSLKVFDVLGQEVVSLVNANLVAGGHSVSFDASSLNSGVYLYRIEATGIDGTNFVDVKKMILTK